jgi:hypothetical protein
MSATLYKELDEYQQVLNRTRKRYAADGTITKEEQAKLNAIEKKIEGVLKVLIAQEEIIVIKDPPPRSPEGTNGDVPYNGIPTEKLPYAHEKQRAEKNARSVRQGIRRIDGWAKHLDQESSEHIAQRHAFSSRVASSEQVNEAFATDLKQGGFRKLSKAAGGQFQQNLANYEKASAAVTKNSKLLEVQAWRIAAAQAMVKQAQSLLEAYDQEKKRAAESSKLAKVKEQLAQTKEWISYYKELAKDPAGAAKKVGLDIANMVVDEVLLELLTGGSYERRIKEIEANIKLIDARLDELKLGGLKAGLDEALNIVKAEQKTAEAVRVELQQAKREQGQAVDHLANIETDHPGTTTVFRQLQQYYGSAQDVGAKTLESSKQYEQAMLATINAMPYTVEIRQVVAQDSSAMRTLYQGDWANMAVLEQEDQARTIVEYTKKIEEWYKKQDVDKQLEEERKLQAALLQNKHFDYVGQLVNAVQEQGLGHVQRDSMTTR